MRELHTEGVPGVPGGPGVPTAPAQGVSYVNTGNPLPA